MANMVSEDVEEDYLVVGHNHSSFNKQFFVTSVVQIFRITQVDGNNYLQASHTKHHRLSQKQVLLFALRIDLTDWYKNHVFVLLAQGCIVVQVIEINLLIVL